MNTNDFTHNIKPLSLEHGLDEGNTEGRVDQLYTDAPKLHSNWLIGCLQLVIWLLVHPSAWRNYVQQLDPQLRPDFTFIDLNKGHWQNRRLRRLLLQIHLIWPLLLGLLAASLFLLPGHSINDHLVDVSFGLAILWAGNLAFGLVVGVTTGLIFAVSAGILGTLMLLLVLLAPGIDSIAAEAVYLSLWVGSVGYVTASIADKRLNRSWTRQTGSVLSGVLVSGLLLGLVLQIAPNIGALIDNGQLLVAVLGLLFVLLVAFILGVAVGWRVGSWRKGLLVSGITLLTTVLSGGTALFFATGLGQANPWFLILIGLAMGIGIGVLFCALFSLPYLLVERLAGSWAGAAAGMIGSCGVYVAFSVLLDERAAQLWPVLPLSVAIMLLSLTMGWWRPLLSYPFLLAWNTLLYRLDAQNPNRSPSLLRWHAAFWDEFQRLPWLGLDRHLLLVCERQPDEGEAALEYLSSTRQRWAAQAAQIKLEVRMLGRCASVAAIGQAHHQIRAGELTGPASALLRSISRISQDVEAALQQDSAYNQRLALSAVEDRLDGLHRELTRSSEPYAIDFQPIATAWRRVISGHVAALAEAVEQRQEIDNPYIIGIPLTEQQEIFIGRTDISARIEQLLLDRRRPPLLLYGQRRMGKTSLLNNLGRLLPSTIVPLFVDLQGPASHASDHAGFLYNMARSMVNSAQKQRGLTLPSLTRKDMASDPFTLFDEWLDQVEQQLDSRIHKTILLTLDEFETLDAPITEGRFSEAAVFGMFRHLIQHRPRFKVLLAGSHTLDEFQRWASYLINVQTVHIGYLSNSEAQQLIERPVQRFALHYEPEAVQRVIALTRGHPALLQLLCAEIVALKNEQDPATRRQATLADVEAAVPEALNHGSFFFADIERNQISAAEQQLLRLLATHGPDAIVGPVDLACHPDPTASLPETLASLSRRELIEVVGGGYRFQVELIRRWFE